MTTTDESVKAISFIGPKDAVDIWVGWGVPREQYVMLSQRPLRLGHGDRCMRFPLIAPSLPLLILLRIRPDLWVHAMGMDEEGS